MLKNKTIIIGVTGGIAAYKTCDVISAFKKLGATMHVIMTSAAQQFITPLTLQTLSNNFVITDMFAEPKTWQVEHIALAKKADLLLIVPATANCIGKLAAGIADDMLTTTVAACTAPVVIAPAMNTAMYNNPIVQDNIKKLKALQYIFVEPAYGHLACGDEGQGRLADTDIIVQTVQNLLQQKAIQDLSGTNILVTAGPTREAIDPIRFLTNRSSGKMGYAIAAEAAKRGAAVTLISGPTNLTVPPGINRIINIESAEDMYRAVLTEFEHNEVIIQSAAIADYRPKHYSALKIKKTDNDICLELERNPDIAYEIGKIKGNKILVGFAAETDHLIDNAVQKIQKKRFDLIVANDITKEGAGCGIDTNIITIIDADGHIHEYPKLLKAEAANMILDSIVPLLSRIHRQAHNAISI